MIYKFQGQATTLEVELFNEENVCFSILNSDGDSEIAFLSKIDLYHLIGALHLLQKEIK